MKKLKRRLPTFDLSTLAVSLAIVALGAGGIGLLRTKALSAGGTCSTSASYLVYFKAYQRWGFQANLYCTTYPNANRIDKVQFDSPRLSSSASGGAGIQTVGTPDQWLYAWVGPTSLIVNPNASGLASIVYLAGPNTNPCIVAATQTKFFNYRIHQLLTNSWGPWHTASGQGWEHSNCGSV